MYALSLLLFACGFCFHTVADTHCLYIQLQVAQTGPEVRLDNNFSVLCTHIKAGRSIASALLTQSNRPGIYVTM